MTHIELDRRDSQRLRNSLKLYRLQPPTAGRDRERAARGDSPHSHDGAPKRVLFSNPYQAHRTQVSTTTASAMGSQPKGRNRGESSTLKKEKKGAPSSRTVPTLLRIFDGGGPHTQGGSLGRGEFGKRMNEQGLRTTL